MKLMLVLLLAVCTSAFAQSVNYFNTNVSDTLRITGSSCQGGGRFSTRSCTNEEWYMTFTFKGQGYSMFLATLERANVMTIPEYSFYYFRPTTPLDASVKDLVNKYWVRFDMNGEAKVLEIE